MFFGFGDSTKKSLILLLTVNLINLSIYLINDSNIEFIIWSYWFQGVVIGLINTIKIIDFKFSKAKDDGLARLSDILFKAPLTIFLGLFFVFHYGGFQLGYYGYLKETFSNSIVLLPIIIQGCLYYVNHLSSYLINRAKDYGKQSLLNLMLFPYIRSAPIHIFIFSYILIKPEKNLLIYFIFFKIIADILIHLIEHNNVRGHKT